MSDIAPREPEDDPGFARVQKYLLYSLSLPERTLRSGSGLVGGALKHSAALLVPAAFQSSKTYTILVRQTLDFLVNDVGGVAAPKDETAPPPVENYIARKTVGNFVEMAGLATLHLSPLTVLAVVSDVAHGSQAYLRELSAELKRQGVIDADTTIDHAGDLLDAVGNASGVTASAFDTPPLSVEGLRETIEQTRAAVARMDASSVIPLAEVERLWNEMRDAARRENVGLFELSSVVTLNSLERIGDLGRGALSSVRVAGNLFDRHILDHYADALTEIRDRGFYATLAETSEPYIEAVWQNFSTEKATLTEDLLTGKLLGQAGAALRRWFGGEPASKDE